MSNTNIDTSKLKLDDIPLHEGIKNYKTCLKESEQQLLDAFKNNITANELVNNRAQIIDHVLKQAWQFFLGHSQTDDSPSLIAVGGYGRSELHPNSDIDLMLLLPCEDDSQWHDAITQFLTFLWDIGLEVGHSVRTLSDCVEQATADITIATNLMEARLLCGSQNMFEKMREQTGPEYVWPSIDFFSAKWEEQIARHNKFDDTAYNLEPNIKEGPGGLRDIQMIGWVAKRHFGAETLNDLISKGFLNEDECNSLLEHQNFLWKIRTALHVLTGRREDRLLFDFQRDLATQFNFIDDGQQLGVEKFMKQYYRTVGELSRLNEMLLQLFQEEILYKHESEEPVIINEHFQSRKGFIEVTDANIFEQQPSVLLEVFLILEQHPELKGVRAETIRLIRNNRYRIDDEFRNNEQCRKIFMEIIRQPQGITHEFRRMHRYGILGAYIPLFADVTGQMQYDLFHVYTVDEHTLFVVRNLRRLTIAEFSNELPHCSQVVHEIEKPEVLYLAGLFHDIGKGRGGDHSELGADDAFKFCQHHYMSNYDSSIVSWLVRQHLIMSRISQREDINDPDVVNNFAELVGNKERLDMLYLLTVADMRATSPTVWNSWKGTLLENLYKFTLKALRKRLNSIDNAELASDIQNKAKQQILKGKIDIAHVEALWDTLNEEYFLRYRINEIVSHAENIIPLAPSELPLVIIRDALEQGGTEVFVHTKITNDIFALVTSIFDQLGLNVADARIIRSSQGYSFDSYIIFNQDGEPVTSQANKDEIANTIRNQLSLDASDTYKVSRMPARQLKHFTVNTDVQFENDSKNQYTIMEVITADRAGLLANIGKTLNENNLQLHNARISTFGARAEDLFYVTDDNGNILDLMTKEILRNAVISALDKPEKSNTK